MAITITRNPDYKDLDLDFLVNPGTNDIAKKVGPEAIKRSIRNLVFTSFYDRPFRSYIGGNTRKMLFEPVTPITAQFLKSAIAETIGNFEPRVSNVDIQIFTDASYNQFTVRLTYIIINTLVPVTTSLVLNRIR